tara:strand:+ start:216 stop:884 length:669 start_codon:yes stop_codon:yes gene_type:complete
LAWGSSAYVITISGTCWVGIYSTVTVTIRAVGSAEILRISSPPGVVGISIVARASRKRGTCIGTIISVPIISSITIAVWGTKIGVAIIAVSKVEKRIIKTQPPIRLEESSIKEGAIAPKGVIKGIIEAPIEIEISPRVVVDIIYLCFMSAISPWAIGIDFNIAITIITGVVVSISECVVLGIVQGRVIIGDVGEIIFVVDPVVIGFGLFGFFDSHFASINTI